MIKKIRRLINKHNKNRLKLSILYILKKSYPFALDVDVLYKRIEEEGLLEMSNKEFKIYIK